MQETITRGLNPAQLEAVTAGTGPMLVVAGPGSGKTRVLTHRIAWLVQALDIAPWQIMAVTFTNKAAREMRERVQGLLGGDLRGILLGTFHASCVRLLRRESADLAAFGYAPDFVIFDADDQKQVIKKALKELNLDEKKFTPQRISSAISTAKDALITPDIYPANDYLAGVIKRVYQQYQATLVANNAMDFDDLLLNTVRLFDAFPHVLARYQERYRYLLVDEFQDTNTVQYGLLSRLAATHHNLFVVGDADQSIYKWRGADYRNLQRFHEDFPGARTVVLEQNYRSTQIILDAAQAVIRQNQDRVDKNLFTTRSGGQEIVIKEAYNESEEADQIVRTISSLVAQRKHEPGDFAVMYRTNAQSRALEEAFMRAGLPYRLVGATRFYSRREIRDVIAFLRLTHNLRDDVSLLRVINVPRRGIGAATIQQLQEWSTGLGMQIGEALVRLATEPEFAHPFAGRALKPLLAFGRLLADWHALRNTLPAAELIGRILADTDFQTYLEDGTDEGRERWENVAEFRAVAASAPDLPLDQFLEQVALVADVDNLPESSNAPTLLTLHAGKGLEFAVVFIVGLEDGLLPHSRTFEDAAEMAEERRLFYVGLTRAKDRLYLYHAFRRNLYGLSDMAQPSRFLADIPGNLVEGGNQLARRRQESVQRVTSWQWDDGAAQTPWQVGSRGASGSYSGERSTRPRPRTFDADQAAEKAKNLPKPKSAEPVPAPPPRVTTARHTPGQHVRHKKFGDGVVIETKLTGNDEEVTVAFPGLGIKKLMAGFANLEVTADG
jgi:DNA helicase-2/ATP-dependent DNA helicase PcrA